MSFSSDAKALDALVSNILAHGVTVDVHFQDGDAIAKSLISPTAIHEAVTCTSDPVRLVLRREALRCGSFLVLLQDDPDCLVVDHSANLLCQSIFDAWFKLAEAA